MDDPKCEIVPAGPLVQLLYGAGQYNFSMLGFRGVYILEHRVSKAPVYVGQGEVGKRLRRHIGAILCGDFCHWIDLDKTSNTTGLAKRTSGETANYVYVPETSGHKLFCMKDAMRFLLSLDAWLIRLDDKSTRELRVIEGCFLRAFNEKYLLANGDLSMNCTEEVADCVRAVVSSTNVVKPNGMPEWLRNIECKLD